MTVCMMVVKPFWPWVLARRRALLRLRDEYPDIYSRLPGFNPFTDVRPIHLEGRRQRVRAAIRVISRELGVEYSPEGA